MDVNSYKSNWRYIANTISFIKIRSLNDDSTAASLHYKSVNLGVSVFFSSSAILPLGVEFSVRFVDHHLYDR